MPYEVVLFDLDFTLFDSERSERKALSATFADYDIAVNYEILETYREFNSQLWSDFEEKRIKLIDLRTERFRRLCRKLGFQMNPGDLADTYEKNLGSYGALYDGAEELLMSMKGQSKVGLITNGLESVQKSRLHNYDLQKYFDVVLISGECGLSKPDPAIFQMSLDLLHHTNKNSVIMIGDSLSSDVQGATNFGIDSCWFNPHGLDKNPIYNPTFTVQSFADIESLF